MNEVSLGLQTCPPQFLPPSGHQRISGHCDLLAACVPRLPGLRRHTGLLPVCTSLTNSSCPLDLGSPSTACGGTSTSIKMARFQGLGVGLTEKIRVESAFIYCLLPICWNPGPFRCLTPGGAMNRTKECEWASLELCNMAAQPAPRADTYLTGVSQAS